MCMLALPCTTPGNQFTMVTQLSGTHNFPVFKSARPHAGISCTGLSAFAGDAHLHAAFMKTASAAWRKSAPQLRSNGLTEEKVRAAFRQMDVDQSGKLNEFELRKVVKTMAPQLTDVDLKLMIACADTDASGLISESEFVTVVMCDHEAGPSFWERKAK